MRDVDALVAELRKPAKVTIFEGDTANAGKIRKLCQVDQALRNEAADALESERSRADRLEKALEPFARLAPNYDGLPPSDAVFAKGCVYVSDLRIARTALGKEDVSD